jgi:hypothetical protein
MNSEECYKKVRDLINKHTVGSTLDWPSVCNELSLLDNPVIPEKDLNFDECNVEYAKKVTKDESGNITEVQNSTENQAWTYSYYLMGWVLYLLKEKINNGHCHNKGHEHGAREPRKCKEGSNFHNGLYEKCLGSFEELIKDTKSHTPKFIT